MDEISRLYREHDAAEYPDGYNTIDAAGVDVVMLDAGIAGSFARLERLAEMVLIAVSRGGHRA